MTPRHWARWSLAFFLGMGLGTSINLVSLSRASANDETYNPFIDYSEFEEASEEEADINFFRNGRFFTLGFTMGQRQTTEGMRNLYGPSLTYGLFLTYFFDMRFAVQVTYTAGSSHSLNLSIPDGSTIRTVTGNASISSFGLALKYYLNTQNVTRGLALFNPYVTVGASSVSRKTFPNSDLDYGVDPATSLDGGIGVEIPLLRKKMFAGFQATYQLVNFKDENTELRTEDGLRTGVTPSGDLIHLTGILGVNF